MNRQRIGLGFRLPMVIPYLHEHIEVDCCDYRWLTRAAFCILENAMSYDDCFGELHQYLIYRLPMLSNDRICLYAAAYGYNYHTALMEVADIYATAIMGMAEGITHAAQVHGMLDLFTRGYTIQGVDFVLDVVSVTLAPANDTDVRTCRETLTPALDAVLGVA